MKQMLPVMDLTSGIGGIAIDEDPAPRRGVLHLFLEPHYPAQVESHLLDQLTWDAILVLPLRIVNS